MLSPKRKVALAQPASRSAAQDGGCEQGQRGQASERIRYDSEALSDFFAFDQLFSGGMPEKLPFLSEIIVDRSPVPQTNLPQTILQEAGITCGIMTTRTALGQLSTNLEKPRGISSPFLICDPPSSPNTAALSEIAAMEGLPCQLYALETPALECSASSRDPVKDCGSASP
jgi:hypothetical protein